MDRAHRLRDSRAALDPADQKELGLPPWDERPSASDATACAGRTGPKSTTTARAFKITCRTAAGVIVTIIADNYFGYCKKEVKTQISYAANLYGNVEEEHSGGAIAFASYSLGDEFDAERYGRTAAPSTTWSRDYAESWSPARRLRRRPQLPDLVYVPATRARSMHNSRSGGRTTAASVDSRCCPARST